MTLDAIGQFYYEVPMGRKNDMLLLLLAEHDPKRSIIFSNTKAMVDELTTFLNENGFKADGLHGDMKQSQRDSVMGAFKGGRTTILVATDVAARGIDVDDIDCVINYDIPTNNEYYVHRIGRTGRAGKSGAAYTICSGRRQVYLMQDIAKATKSEVIKLEIPTAASILKKQRLLKQEELISKMELSEELPYLDVVEELVAQGYSAEQIAAAALGMVYGVEESTLPVIQMEKKRRKGDFIKIRINIGREHRIAPNFIVGAIAVRTSLSGQDIGKIEIFDEDTLVEIPRSSEEEVLSAMVGCKINGIDTETRRWLTKEEMKARKSRDFSEEAPKKERAPKEKGGFFHREKKEKKDWDKKEKHKDGKKFGFADRKPFNKEGKKDFKKNSKKGFGRDFKKDKKSEKKGNFGRSKKFLFDEE